METRGLLETHAHKKLESVKMSSKSIRNMKEQHKSGYKN